MMTMSGVIALKRLRNIIRARPELSPLEAAMVAQLATADGGVHDYSYALVLHSQLDPLVTFDDFSASIREILRLSLTLESPSWLPLATKGRRSVRSVLENDPNMLQLFSAGELFDEVPSVDVIEWWDSVANDQRNSLDVRKVKSGRDAERKSMALEVSRLEVMGCPFKPEWIALNDNSAGYDILSYELEDSDWVSKAIEVKSSLSSSVRFYLSRNEYETAMRMSSRYELHFWGEGYTAPVCIPGATVVSHCPADQGDGVWQEVFIRLSRDVQ